MDIYTNIYFVIHTYIHMPLSCLHIHHRSHFYGLFSLLLYSRDERLIEEVLLSQYNLKDANSIGEVPGEVRRKVLDQLYELLDIIDAGLFPDKRLKTYYMLLLDNYYGYLNQKWFKVYDLIKLGVISKEEAVAHKNSFLELLESIDERTKSSAWDKVPDLIKLGVISEEDVKRYSA